MAEQFAPDQLPAEAPVAVDPPAKRAKFLSKFAALDPEADLNEESLGGILTDPAKRDEFTKYVNQLNPDFTMSGQELADALGYGVEKKSPGGNVSSTGSPNTPSAPNGSTGVNLDQLQAQEGIAPVDVSSQAVAPIDQPFAAAPQIGPLGYQLPGAPAPDAESTGQTLAAPAMLTDDPGRAYLGEPASYAPDQLGADATQVIEQRGPAPLPSTGDSPRNEQEILDTFPSLKPGDYPTGLNLEDDNDLVAIPPNYQGGTPTGTQLDPATGLRYFRRPLSNKVGGKEQTRAEAFGTSFLNASKEILQGAGEGLQAVGNLALSGTNPATVATMAANPLTFGDELSERIEKTKGELAPLYTAPGRNNINTMTVQAGAFAPMVLAQVAQTLVPETRLPGLLKAAVGLAGTAAFDAPIIHGARERAKAAGLKGTAADAYTVFEAALTLGAFKMGGKLLGQAGDAAVLKAAPKEFSEGVALDAAKRVGAMEQQLGRALTTSEQQAALSQSLAAALPRLAKFAKGTLQQGALMPLAGTATAIGNQVGARALGGTAEEITAESFLQDRARDVGAGLLMGGATEGVAAGLDAAGAMIRRPATSLEATPIQADPDTVYYVAGDATTTAEGSISDVRILGPGAQPGTVRVRGTDIEGNQTEHDVAQYRMAPQAELDAMQAEEDAQQPTATQSAPETVIDPILAAAPDGAPTPFPADRVAAIERLNRMQQRLAERKAAQAGPEPALESAAITNDPAQAAPITPSTPEPEPSPLEAAAAPASPPDAVRGEVPAADEAVAAPRPEPLPAATPDPTQAKKLTSQQQATNDTLDAFDRYNSLKPGQQKGKEGSAARAELDRTAKKAGIDMTVDKNGKVTLAGGKRLTRSNEYTATTPAANHVPLDARPEDAHAFMEALLFTGDQNNPSELQGLGIKIRGKELSGRELSDAVKDIRAGRNTMRAQLVLDTLENGYRQGYLEKSTGTGLATRKFQVPIEDYLGQPDTAMEAGERELTDQEWDDALSADPNLAEAVATYTDPVTGEIDYTRFAADSERGALETFFDVPTDVATKITALANERAQQKQPASPVEQIQRGPAPADEATALTGSATEGSPQPSGPAAPSPGPAANNAERGRDAVAGAGADAGSEGVASLTDTVVGQSAAPTLAEQNIAAKAEFAQGLAEFRAARKKGSGIAQSSILGVPAFSAEEAAALTKMAKAAVKLGAVKTKQVIARLRAQGLTDDDVTDEQLRPFVKQLLADEGVRQPKMKQVADNPAEATGERANAKRYDQATQDALTAEERNYVPSAAKIAANERPADFIKRVGIDQAYEIAVGRKPEGVDELLHDNLIRAVGDHYTAERNTALKSGDTPTADAAQERLMRAKGALAKTGTAQAQALQARVGAGGTIGDLISAPDPAATGRATVDAALGEIANRNVEGQQQNDADAAEVVTQAKPKRQRKMAEALESTSVKAAVDKAAGTTTPPTPAAPADKAGYGDTNKFFTKAKVAEWRKQLKSMAFSAPLPSEAILLGAYHLEASTRRFTEWSAKMVREAGVRIRPRLGELYDLSKTELLKKDPAAVGFNTPEEVAAIVARQQAPGAVREGVKDLGKRLTDIAKQHASDIESDRRTLTDKFIQDAGLSGEAATAVAAAIEIEWNKRVEKVSWQTLRGRFQPKRARAKLDALNRLTNDLNVAGNLPETTMRSPVAQLLEKLIGNNVPVSAAEAQHIESLKDAYVQAAKRTTRTIGGQQVETQNTKAVAKAAIDMLAAIGKLKNVDQQDWTREVGAMFYVSLLSSPNTHIANAYLNTLSTAHEVGLISSISTAANAGLAQTFQPIAALFPGYKRGANDAYDVVTTGIDLKTKVGGSLSDKDFQTDPLEERSVVRGRILQGLQKIGIGKGLSAPDKSAARYVKRALGGSDTFFQGGLAEARAREVAVKTAARTVERRRASGETMTRKEVRQFVHDEVDRILFNTPEAIADINAIVASEGLGSPKTLTERVARNARIGDLLDQARAAANPELVADAKEFAARHAGNSEYEGHLGSFAYSLANTFKSWPVVGKIVVPFAKVTSNFQNRYAEWAGLGFYRAVQGGAGKPIFGKVGEIDKRFVREYSPEEREKAFLRSTIGTLVGMTAAALLKAGYVAITGLPTGNKDEDQQRPAQSIVVLQGPLKGTSFTYKGMNEEIALTTLAQTMAWAKKKQLADDDPDVTDRLEAVALITAASTLNLGPSNGAGDFLGTISKVGTNPEAWFKTMERMAMTGTKTVLMPAGVNYAVSLLNQATDANLPQKQSNDAWQQFKLQVWGDVPSYLGGPDRQDALDVFGDPMRYASNRFWGVEPINNDPQKQEAKRILVSKGLMPNDIRITDRRLRLYDPAHGNKVSEMTNQEYHDFCEARGKAFYQQLTQNGGYKIREIEKAATSKSGAKFRNEAIEAATTTAKLLIETRRANAGAAAKFKLGRVAKAERDLRLSRGDD